MTPMLDGKSGEAPKPTTASPAACRSAVTSGVEVGYTEFDENRGAPEARRNPVTTTRRSDAASLQRRQRRGPGATTSVWHILARNHTNPSPTITSIVGQMKLCDRMFSLGRCESSSAHKPDDPEQDRHRSEASAEHTTNAPLAVGLHQHVRPNAGEDGDRENAGGKSENPVGTYHRPVKDRYERGHEHEEAHTQRNQSKRAHFRTTPT